MSPPRVACGSMSSGPSRLVTAVEWVTALPSQIPSRCLVSSGFFLYFAPVSVVVVQYYSEPAPRTSF